MKIQESNDYYILEWQKLLHQLIKVYYEDMNKGEIDNEDANDIKKTYKQLILVSNEENNFIYYLKIKMQLNNHFIFFMMLGFLFEIDSRFRSFCEKNFRTKHLTFEMGFLLLQYVEKIHFSDIFSILSIQPLTMMFKQTKQVDYILQKSMILQPWIIQFIEGGYFDKYEGVNYYLNESESLLPLMKKEYEEIEKLLDMDMQFVMIGKAGAGKKSLLKQYANKYQRVIQFIDVKTYESLEYNKQNEYKSLIYFFSIIYDSINVLIYKDIADCDLEIYLDNNDLSYISLKENNKISKKKMITIPESLKYSDMLQVISYYDLDSSLAEYHYTIEEMLALSKQKQVDKTSMLIHNTYVDRIFTLTNIDEYICNVEVKEMIHLILYEMKHRKYLSHCLNQNKYNRGMQLLLYGPSGSGKTMLATIFANELRIPLYKINLSMINDKFIGESEKHLESIFNEAEKENCILLFDEADVLFAKRTNINNSNDRYANTITAYLLQRIENYDGIIILTSNFINNFDDAFIRRMRYVMRLSKPDPTMIKNKIQMIIKRNEELFNLNIDELDFLKDFSLAQLENVFFISTVLAKKDQRLVSLKDVQKAFSIEKKKSSHCVNV